MNSSPPIAGGAHTVSVMLPATPMTRVIGRLIASQVAMSRIRPFNELTKVEQQAAGLAQDVIKADRKAQLQMLTAPIDGIVQQLVVHTV